MIKFTENEAIALRNISEILLGYIDTQNVKTQFAGSAKILLDIHNDIDNGEREFNFSKNNSEFLIDVLNFWYKGIGVVILKNKDLEGKARERFTLHYNLVPSIIKKLNKWDNSNS